MVGKIGPLLVRADGNAEIGTGHVMRCLALAQAWQSRGGDVVLAVAIGDTAIEARIRDEGIQFERSSGFPGSAEDGQKTVELARNCGASWVIADGYHFGPSFQQTIKEADIQLLVIDDNGENREYHADLVLNQNIHAHERMYRKRATSTRLLLGTGYALLRKEFLRWRDWERKISQVAAKILVTMGGGDQDNVTGKVVDALRDFPPNSIEAKVVVGGVNPHHAKLSSAARDAEVKIDIKRNVSNMPELMAWADIAVTGGGSTCWEMAFMALPSLTIVMAENQRGVAAGLNERGGPLSLGWWEEVGEQEIVKMLSSLMRNVARRTEMSQLGRELVDGDGCERVLEAIMPESTVILRPAREDDCNIIWEWANDPVVRAASFAPDAIPLEVHKEWFSAKLADPDSLLMIAENGAQKPFGHVRFDIVEGKKALASINLAHGWRGKGLGAQLVRKGCSELMRRTNCETVCALIKKDNGASVRAFERAGFSVEKEIEHKGSRTLVLERQIGRARQ